MNLMSPRPGIEDTLFPYLCGTETGKLWVVHKGGPHWAGCMEGGRLLIFLTVAFPTDGSAVISQAGRGSTLLVTRRGDRYAARFVSPVAVFHCIGARDSASEQLLEEAFKNGGQADVRSLRRDRHDLNAECWLHASGFCLSRLDLD
jgi:hypothetical protein